MESVRPRKRTRTSAQESPWVPWKTCTTAALVAATGGQMRGVTVVDPLGRPLRARFGLLGGGRRAVLEMAEASGLGRLSADERDPLRTSTRGTGQLLLAAVEAGARQIIVGLGGSATVDGGSGMARALGVRLLDTAGRELPEGGGALVDLAHIDTRGLDPRLAGVEILAPYDVDNPLLGPRGAAAVYGPQKGATEAMVRHLERGLARLSQVIRRQFGVDVAPIPGMGAAGGLAAFLLALFSTRLEPGALLVAQTVGLARRMEGCQLVITGEGCSDAQTLFGKVPMGVLAVAQEQGVPVILLSGSLGPGWEALPATGFAACFAALERPLSPEDLPREGPAMLRRTARQVARLWGGPLSA